MRVHDTQGNFEKNLSGTRKIGEKKPAKALSRDKVNDMNFMMHLNDATEDQIKRSLDQLLEDLTEQANVLAKRRTFTELEKYKSLVKNFMKNVIEKMYSVKFSDSSKMMQKKKKVYVLVDKVDEALEELTRQVLSNQAESLQVLDMVGKIRGMLVDMYS